MDKLVYLLPVLGCVAMMGMMMLMMRGNHGNHGTAAAPDAITQDEIASLRAEIDAVRAQQTAQSAESQRIAPATSADTP